MRSKKVFIGLLLIVAVLLLGIGYAVISNVTLNVSGSASATASDANFTVKFDKSVTPTTSNATASITGDKEATIAVSGLTTKGDTATATYTVINESADLGASLSASITKNTNSYFFAVTHEFAETTLAAGESTTVTVTVELIKTPATDQSGEVGVQLIAQPVQDVEASDTEEIELITFKVIQYPDPSLGSDYYFYNSWELALQAPVNSTWADFVGTREDFSIDSEGYVNLTWLNKISESYETVRIYAQKSVPVSSQDLIVADARYSTENCFY